MIIPNLFSVIAIPQNARDSPEPMGSKEKFWFKDDQLGLSLYKVARPGTGEDWSEKAAEQIAGLLGLPHARYELAQWHNPSNGNDIRGVMTPTLLQSKRHRLISGNELLVAQVRGYPSSDAVRPYKIRQHTLENVLNLIQGTEAGLPPEWNPIKGIDEPIDLFVGYLLLDAWVGNTDRHHENWAFIEYKSEIPGCSPVRFLSPTFDHASCLGRNESESRRELRLRTKDVGFSVAAYATKARSALYRLEVDTRPLTVSEAFRQTATARPEAARVWQHRLASIREDDLTTVFGRIPTNLISPVAVEFALAMLRENKRLLLDS